MVDYRQLLIERNGRYKAVSWAELLVLQRRTKLTNVSVQISRYQRRMRRSFLRTLRRTRAILASQYYLASALRDGRQAFARNEDIGLTCLLLTALAAFALVSIASNAVYSAMLATAAFADGTGINLGFMAIATIGVMAVLAFWIACWCQNMLAITLLEGARRKVKRSLRRTIRLGLRYASTVATAWVMIALLAAVPVMVPAVLSLLVSHIFGLHMSAMTPYLLAIGVLGLLWSLIVLTNCSLVPSIVIFERHGSWRSVFTRSYHLLQHKGRLFVLGNYLASGAILAALYGLGLLVQKLANMDSVYIFGICSWLGLAFCNANLTMLYRKRCLARNR